MDYDALRLFLHLSRTLHFLRTSRACHVSPSALSRGIQRLERETGWPLFERDRRSVRLTPEGTRFAAHARETLERWDALERDLRGRRETLSGTIVLFASVTACQTFLPELLSEFRQRHPDIHIQLETGYAADALEHLAEGRVDVSIAAIPSQVPRALVARVLLHTPLVFAAPRAACEVERLSHRRPIPWAELPIVLPASGQARESADRWFRRRRITPGSTASSPAARRSWRWSVSAAASASYRASCSRRAPSPPRFGSSMPTTVRTRSANSASASARSARSWAPRWCRRSGIRFAPREARSRFDAGNVMGLHSGG